MIRSVTIVVRTTDRDRAAEALRAAVGLTLRGAAVSVVRARPIDESDPRVKKCLHTLSSLGHAIDAPPAAARAANAVEVWT
jgi:hypothetical protein